MKQIPPTFRQTDKRKMSPTHWPDPIDIDRRFPIQEVSTGLPFLITPLLTLDAVKKEAADRRARLGALLRGLAAEGVLVFAPESYHPENQLNVRGTCA